MGSNNSTTRVLIRFSKENQSSSLFPSPSNIDFISFADYCYFFKGDIFEADSFLIVKT